MSRSPGRKQENHKIVRHFRNVLLKLWNKNDLLFYWCILYTPISEQFESIERIWIRLVVQAGSIYGYNSYAEILYVLGKEGHKVSENAICSEAEV